MKQNILIIILLIFNNCLSSSQNIEFLKQLNSFGSGNSVKVDNEKNIIFVGYTCGSYNPGTEKTKIHIVKFDSLGTIIWQKKYIGNNNGSAVSLDIDKNNNLFISGNFSDTVNFDNTLLISKTPNKSDVFIIKLDKNGSLLWAKSFGGKKNDECKIINLLDSSIYLYGSFEDTLIFQGNNLAISRGQKDLFLTKLDSIGNFIWVKSFGSISDDEPNHFEVNKTGIIITGSFFNNFQIYDTTLVLKYPSGLVHLV